jgi:hypothetical protein
MWAPERFAERRTLAREKVREHRRLFAGMTARPREGNET